jgi:hypothetical protein
VAGRGTAARDDADGGVAGNDGVMIGSRSVGDEATIVTVVMIPDTAKNNFMLTTPGDGHLV